MTPVFALLALALTATTLGYAGLCLVAPFAACWWCRGTGLERARGCLYCHDTGLRARLGWRLVRVLTQLKHESTR